MQTATRPIKGVNVVIHSDDDGELLCRVWNRDVIQIADRFRSRCGGRTSYVATSRKSALRTAERLAGMLER